MTNTSSLNLYSIGNYLLKLKRNLKGLLIKVSKPESVGVFGIEK